MKRTKMMHVMAGVLIIVFGISCKKNDGPGHGADKRPNDLIIEWNEIACKSPAGETNPHVLLSSRIYALMHIAMFDAVNATDKQYASYAFNGTDKKADPEAAAASAAHRILQTFLGNSGFLDSALNNSIAKIKNGEAKEKGKQLGILAADALLALNHNENGNIDPLVRMDLPNGPGQYQFVPPFDFAFAPFWENSKLFSLQRKDQFRSVPPPALNSDAYTIAFNEVKELGDKNSDTRTQEQTFYAKYWYELSQDGWNRIARVVASQKETGLLSTARFFALLNMAVADSYVAGWDSKLHYNFWRPYSAIRAAATDGNDATTADVNWEPAEVTPPIHDYPSTHSVLGNAAAAVLAYEYGDNTTFTMKSPSAEPKDASRTFFSFYEAAAENADSRVMAGIHFRFSCNAGLEMGERIGKWTVENHLKPLE